ncbi:MAG: Transcriptional regulatory protein BtsR [bacterium]|nr:Transcriptional regulatory protein BtsR [bacterium]
MEKIRTIIVDDEPLARDSMRVLLERDAEIELAAECANGREALEAIQRLAPDLLFLDVQMPEMNGFEMLAQVETNRLPVVIFVTAYDQHALRAFEVHALDYLLKSYSDDRFEAALRRAKEQIRQKKIHAISQRLVALLDSQKQEKAPTPPEPGTYLTRLVVKSGGRVFFLKTAEIDWIEAADYYVYLHVGGKSHLLRETMNTLEKQLDPRKFQRLHRSTIVNLDRLKELQPHTHGDYTVTLQDGTALKLSRSYRPKLEAALGRSL